MGTLISKIDVFVVILRVISLRFFIGKIKTRPTSFVIWFISVWQIYRISEKQIRCIRNLYWIQTARMQINVELTDAIPISKGVICSQQIFHESLEGEKIGRTVQGHAMQMIPPLLLAVYRNYNNF